MPLPVTFANLTSVPLADLDSNFSALGALVPIPCTVAGTNALVLTPTTAPATPTITSYTNYQMFTCVVSATNTGPVTVQVGALTALSAYKDTPSGPVALTGGELVAKDLAYFFYDSSLNAGAGGFHAVSQAGFPVSPVVGSNRSLKGSSAGGGVTATWTATELVAEVAVGGEGVKGVNLSLSFNGATIGANGMDTGAVPTSGQLAVYAIHNPTTNAWATLGYNSDTIVAPSVYAGANMPSGYVYSTLIWVGVTDASAHILRFFQIGSRVNLNGASVLSAMAVAANTWYSQSLSVAVPYSATEVWGRIAGSVSTVDLAAAVASDSSGGYAQSVVIGKSGAALGAFYEAGAFTALPMLTPQTLWWESGNTTQTVNLLITGYTF